MARNPPSNDERKRSDKDGRFWCQCAFCKRWFKHWNRHVRVCGAILDPPMAWCCLCDWPSMKPRRGAPTAKVIEDPIPL
jgi:hypothetical protein